MPAGSVRANLAWEDRALVLSRGHGPDFSERDRALLTLLRPHLHQAYLDAERRRHPVPRLTPRQTELLHLVAAGHTNTQIALLLGISEATVRSHLENIPHPGCMSPAAPPLSPAPSPTGSPSAHRFEAAELALTDGLRPARDSGFALVGSGLAGRDARRWVEGPLSWAALGGTRTPSLLDP